MNWPNDFINQVITGNHLEVMSFIPNEVIDLTVTSPPYDNLRDYQGYDFKFEPLAKELYRVTKKGGVVVWVVGDATIDGSETGTSFRQALYFKKIGFNLHDTMIYHKRNFSHPERTRYHSVFEYMFILSVGSPKTLNLIKDKVNLSAGTGPWGRNTMREQDGTMGERVKKINTKYGMRGNVWLMKTTGQEKPCQEQPHPATFPESLARDHILSWSNLGDIILDPMCGSGTTLKMAKQYNRKYIGIEISPEYCKIAEERLKQEVFPI